MLEFIVTDAPMVWPQMCATCAGQKGPLADTHRELPAYGRVYVCLECAKRLARVHGLVKGKRMDELSNAARELLAKQQECDQYRAYCEELETKLAEVMRISGSWQEQAEYAAGRVEQLETRIQGQAQSMRELVIGAVEE